MVIASMMWPVTGFEPAGTPRRPSRPTTTWPSSSAASSSPPDFGVHALSRPPRKKPGPFSQPGPPPEHDQPALRNTRAYHGDNLIARHLRRPGHRKIEPQPSRSTSDRHAEHPRRPTYKIKRPAPQRRGG